MLSPQASSLEVRSHSRTLSLATSQTIESLEGHESESQALTALRLPHRIQGPNILKFLITETTTAMANIAYLDALCAIDPPDPLRDPSSNPGLPWRRDLQAVEEPPQPPAATREGGHNAKSGVLRGPKLLGRQIAQSRSQHILGPDVGILYILGAL